MTTGIRLGGLSSGMDTESIITQLMAIERQPRTRIELKQSAAQARQDALRDISTKLKALKTATSNLNAASTWAPTQSVVSSDPAKVGVRATGSITPGTYDVTVQRLAVREEETWSIRQRGSTQRLTFTDVNGQQTFVDVPPSSDIDEVVATINAKSGLPVTARNFNGQLLLSAKAMGAPSDFSVSGGVLDTRTNLVDGVDAQYTVNGVAKTSSTNNPADAITGAELTLSGLTSSAIRITVGEAKVDAKALAAKAKAFVDAYNAVVDATRSRLSEKRVLNPTNTTDAKKGVLFGDSALSNMLSQVRNAVMDPLTVGNSSAIDELAEIGIWTGAPTGGSSTPDSVAGKLVFDEAKFTSAYENDPSSVERLLRGNGGQVGFWQRLDGVIDPYTKVDGLLDGRITASTSELSRLGSDLKRMDARLANKETYLRRQFTTMETMLSQLNAQSAELSSRLPSANSNSGS